MAAVQIPSKVLLGKFVTLKDPHRPPTYFLRVAAAGRMLVIIQILDVNGHMLGKLEYDRGFFDEFFTIAQASDAN